MKRIILSLLIFSFMTCSLSSRTSASEDVILSCQIVPNDTQNINTDNEPEFKITVMTYSEHDNGLINTQIYRERSCVEILAKLVKNEGFEMKGVSSPDNGTAYTLLQRN